MEVVGQTDGLMGAVPAGCIRTVLGVGAWIGVLCRPRRVRRINTQGGSNTREVAYQMNKKCSSRAMRTGRHAEAGRQHPKSPKPQE